jgi:hypothetical protein
MYAYHFLLPQQRTTEAIEQMTEGLSEDPLNLVRQVHLAICLAAAGKMDASASRLHQVLETDSSCCIALVVDAANALAQGDLVTAFDLAQRAHAGGHWNAHTTGLLAGLASRRGEHALSSRLLEKIAGSETCGSPTGLLDYELVRGNVDRAVHWCAKAIGQRDLLLPILLQHPYASPLRASRQWPVLAALLRMDRHS